MQNSRIIFATLVAWFNFWVVIWIEGGSVWYDNLAPYSLSVVILVSFLALLILFYGYGFGWDEDFWLLIKGCLVFLYISSGGVANFLGMTNSSDFSLYVKITGGLTFVVILYNFWQGRRDKRGIDGVGYGLPESFKNNRP